MPPFHNVTEIRHGPLDLLSLSVGLPPGQVGIAGRRRCGLKSEPISRIRAQKPKTRSVWSVKAIQRLREVT